jgi:hypothetical protein
MTDFNISICPRAARTVDGRPRAGRGRGDAGVGHPPLPHLARPWAAPPPSVPLGDGAAPPLLRRLPDSLPPEEEKNMAIPPEMPPGSGASRHADWQAIGRRTMVVIATVLLTATFVLAGATDPPQCRGEKPGVCPYSTPA